MAGKQALIILRSKNSKEIDHLKEVYLPKQQQKHTFHP